MTPPPSERHRPLIATEIRPIPSAPHRRPKELAARHDAAEGASRVSDIVASLLEESETVEFRSAERLLDALERQGRTIAGYPRVRPDDCEQFLSAMRQVLICAEP